MPSFLSVLSDNHTYLSPAKADGSEVQLINAVIVTLIETICTF